MALRLIGHYQAGQDPTMELAFQPGPLPKFDGGLRTELTIQPSADHPLGALQPQATGSGSTKVPPLTSDRVNQYAALFEKSGAQNGFLPSEQAKQIFEQACLPNEIQHGVYNLVNTEQRGALVVTEFIIAMHLLVSYISGALCALPSVLPADLYEAAFLGVPAWQISGVTPGAEPMFYDPIHFSGASSERAESTLSRPSYFVSPQTAQMAGQVEDWGVSPTDKARFDSIYNGLDETNKGFIAGDEAVAFFSSSALPDDVLADIWDLADINSDGRLTRDEFAVAMYLIRQQRSQRNAQDSMPESLPPNLVPPGMRTG
jgi:epidermal growth factor receptor substrate 15